MQKGLEDGHQRIFVLTQETEGDLAGSTERPYVHKSILAARFNSLVSLMTYHCIRKRRRRQSCSASGEMEPLRASRRFAPACDEHLHHL